MLNDKRLNNAYATFMQLTAAAPDALPDFDPRFDTSLCSFGKASLRLP